MSVDKRALIIAPVQGEPLRFGAAMGEGEAPPEGVTVQTLLAACGSDILGLRDAALMSLAYDAGLRVSELVGTTVDALRQVGEGTGRVAIAHSKTDQAGEGAMAWLSPDTMARVSGWLTASGIMEGAVFRRINVLASKSESEGQQVVRHFIGAKALTRQGVVAILRRRVLAAIDLGHVELEPGMEDETVRALSAHSFRVGPYAGSVCGRAGRRRDCAGAPLVFSDNRAVLYTELAVVNNAAARILRKLRRVDAV